MHPLFYFIKFFKTSSSNFLNLNEPKTTITIKELVFRVHLMDNLDFTDEGNYIYYFIGYFSKLRISSKAHSNRFGNGNECKRKSSLLSILSRRL